MADVYSRDGTMYLINERQVVMQCHTVKGNSKIHKHDFIEIAYVDAGHGTHETEDGYVTFIEKGSLILLNPHTGHLYNADPLDPLTVYNCIFVPSMLDEYIKKDDDFINIVYRLLFEESCQGLFTDKRYIMLNGALEIGPIIREMFTEYTQQKKGYTRVNNANLVRLLIAIFRVLERRPALYCDAYQKTVAESAMEYMRQYYAEPIKCEELASRAYLSVGAFHRIFKQATGDTAISYLQKIRMERAAELLRDTSLSVSRIAASIGYADTKYFYIVFERIFHLTPKQYRETIKDTH